MTNYMSTAEFPRLEADAIQVTRCILQGTNKQTNEVTSEQIEEHILPALDLVKATLEAGKVRKGFIYQLESSLLSVVEKFEAMVPSPTDGEGDWTTVLQVHLPVFEAALAAWPFSKSFGLVVQRCQQQRLRVQGVAKLQEVLKVLKKAAPDEGDFAFEELAGVKEPLRQSAGIVFDDEDDLLKWQELCDRMIDQCTLKVPTLNEHLDILFELTIHFQATHDTMHRQSSKLTILRLFSSLLSTSTAYTSLGDSYEGRIAADRDRTSLQEMLVAKEKLTKLLGNSVDAGIHEQMGLKENTTNMETEIGEVIAHVVSTEENTLRGKCEAMKLWRGGL